MCSCTGTAASRSCSRQAGTVGSGAVAGRCGCPSGPGCTTVAGQEVLTSDGLSVKVSLLVRSRVVDPRRWHEAVEVPDGFLYGAVQVALREAASTRTLDEFLLARSALPAELVSAAAAAAEEVGVALRRSRSGTSWSRRAAACRDRGGDGPGTRCSGPGAGARRGRLDAGLGERGTDDRGQPRAAAAAHAAGSGGRRGHRRPHPGRPGAVPGCWCARSSAGGVLSHDPPSPRPWTSPARAPTGSAARRRWRRGRRVDPGAWRG